MAYQEEDKKKKANANHSFVTKAAVAGAKYKKTVNNITSVPKESSFGATMQAIRVDKKTGKKTYGPVRRMNFKTITEKEFNR